MQSLNVTALSLVFGLALGSVALGADQGSLFQAQILPNTAATDRAETLLNAAEQLRDTSDDPKAVIAAYQRALAAYDALDNPYTSLSVLADLVEASYRACLDDQAIDWTQQAIARLDVAADPALYLQWLNTLGQVYQDAGQPDKAITTYRDALNHSDRQQQTATTSGLIWQLQNTSLRSLLTIYGQQNASAQIEPLVQQLTRNIHQLVAIEQVSDLIEVVTYSDLSIQPQVTLPLLQNALQISREANYPQGELEALTLLGEITLGQGSTEAAIRYGQEALTIVDGLTDNAAQRARLLQHLGASYRAQGDFNAAQTYYRQLLALIESADSNDNLGISEASAVSALVDVLLAADQFEAATQVQADYSELLATSYYPFPSLSLPFAYASFSNTPYLLYQRDYTNPICQAQYPSRAQPLGIFPGMN